MNVAEWLAAAIADAERRGLSELKPMLEALARSTDALHRADEERRTAQQPPAPDTPHS